MILTFGSSRRAASQSVETSGSSVAGGMDANLPAFPLFVIAGLDPAIHLFFEKMDTRVKPACDSLSTLRLLRLHFLDRSRRRRARPRTRRPYARPASVPCPARF